VAAPSTIGIVATCVYVSLEQPFYNHNFMLSPRVQGTLVEKGCPKVTVLIITNFWFNRRLLLESRQVHGTDNHLRGSIYYF
jgi:hypothetical protein